MQQFSPSSQTLVKPLSVAVVNVHGRVRLNNPLELGVDPDTGGQTLYVVQIAKALAEREDISDVTLYTRLINDAELSSDYAQEVETLEGLPKLRIVRLRCGPNDRYLRKEALWDHLSELADRLLDHVHQGVSPLPDVVYAHYGDAGCVGRLASNILGVPLVFVSHSLGRVKQRRMASSAPATELEKTFRFSKRIEEEELTLQAADAIIGSTTHEVLEQYSTYDSFRPDSFQVLTPGVSLEAFALAEEADSGSAESEAQLASARSLLEPFLRDMNKPCIVAVARPVPWKNALGLVRAYGMNPELQEQANLVLLMGTRKDWSGLEEEQRELLTQILVQIDKDNLYGKVAYPKFHERGQVPWLLQYARKVRGVFANVATFEPFGLTILEASAAGLPVVATNVGGPRDLLPALHNGALCDPLDIGAISETLQRMIELPAEDWERLSQAGQVGVNNFSWWHHAEMLVDIFRNCIDKSPPRPPRPAMGVLPPTSHEADENPLFKVHFSAADRVCVFDIDNTLTGDREAVAELFRELTLISHRALVVFATGRSFEAAQTVLAEWNIPLPDVLATGVGAVMHAVVPVEPYTEETRATRFDPAKAEERRNSVHFEEVKVWQRHTSHGWSRDKVSRFLVHFRGITEQEEVDQHPHKFSVYVDPSQAPAIASIVSLLRRSRVRVNIVYSDNLNLDILPMRVSKGSALRFLSRVWGIPVRRFAAAGDSGNDRDMMSGATRSIIVGNHSQDLSNLEKTNTMYYSKHSHAAGVLDGLRHYKFFDSTLGSSLVSPTPSPHTSPKMQPAQAPTFS